MTGGPRYRLQLWSTPPNMNVSSTCSRQPCLRCSSGWAAAAATQTPLAGVKSLRCAFTRQATGSWAKGDVPETSARSSSLVLRFEAIDTESGTAQLRNGAMTTDVTVRLAEGYLHLMQAFRTGPLYTTTVFEAGATREPSGRSIPATNSSRRLCPARPQAQAGRRHVRSGAGDATLRGRRGFIVSGTGGAFGSSNCWMRPFARVMLRRFCGASGARRRYSRNWVAASSYLASSLNSSPRL